jgi:hypothetical protein
MVHAHVNKRNIMVVHVYLSSTGLTRAVYLYKVHQLLVVYIPLAQRGSCTASGDIQVNSGILK